MKNGATSETELGRTRRRGVRALAPAVATAFFGLLLAIFSLPACMAPCQRHSDCKSPWTCSENGACEPPPVEYDDPIDAGHNSVPDLFDGALDDSDLGDLPPDADLPDAS
jgi:hypothetical protein